MGTAALSAVDSRTAAIRGIAEISAAAAAAVPSATAATAAVYSCGYGAAGAVASVQHTRGHGVLRT